jgi:hypothetical protein
MAIEMCSLDLRLLSKQVRHAESASPIAARARRAAMLQ